MIQVLINGLVSGAGIALLAVAFQVIYLPTRVLFIALAGTFVLAPYITLTIMSMTGSLGIGIAIALAASILITVLSEWANHGPLSRKNASAGVQLIASLGVYIVIVQTIAMIWGNGPQTLRQGLDFVSRWGDIVITGGQWFMFIIALVLLGAFATLLYSSDLGLRLRALADNPRMFAIFGYNIDRYRILAFSLGGLFAGAAGISMAYDIGFYPHAGLHAVLLAIVAVIIGGRTSFIGPIIGGLLLGIIRAQFVWHFSARWQEAVTFGLLALFLIFRPQGIISRKQRVEAE